MRHLNKKKNGHIKSQKAYWQANLDKKDTQIRWQVATVVLIIVNIVLYLTK